MDDLRAGDAVSVRVSNPKYGWGKVTRKSVGVYIGRNREGHLIVHFPENRRFHAAWGELKKVNKPRVTPPNRTPHPRSTII